MTRDQIIAHLVLHGWRPIREIPSAMNGHGVYNDSEQRGFRVTAFDVTRKMDRHDAIEDVDWFYINDAKLAILAAAAVNWAPAP